MPTPGQKALAARSVDASVNLADKTMGFAKAAAKVAAKGKIPTKRARAIIAAGAQRASAKAKKANPNLKKVATKGSKKQSDGTYKK